jgi:hypothetical protein
LAGRPAKWIDEELKLIGTRPDREVAKLLNRSFSAVKGKKLELLRKARKAPIEADSSSELSR